MCDTLHKILNEKDFRKIGSLDYRIHLSSWWHNKDRIGINLLPIGSKTIVKGYKTYYLKSISEEGTTWIRDIGPVQSWLETHCPEFHISFSYFRNISKSLAFRRIKEKFAIEKQKSFFPSVSQIAFLQEVENAGIQDVDSLENLLKQDSGSSVSLQSYMKDQIGELKQKIQQLRPEIAKQKARRSLFENLQRQYLQKSSAACFVFSLSSNIQLATTPEEFSDTVDSILKELTDAHRYQVSQKLGGKLNIQIKEAHDPVMAWIEEWFGGALSPRQLSKFKDELELFEII